MTAVTARPTVRNLHMQIAYLTTVIPSRHASKAGSSFLVLTLLTRITHQLLLEFGGYCAQFHEVKGLPLTSYLSRMSQVEVLPSLEAAEQLQLEYSSYTVLEEGAGELWAGIVKADGAKCERCWNYSEAVGTFVEHPTLCERCHPVIQELSPKEPVVV